MKQQSCTTRLTAILGTALLGIAALSTSAFADPGTFNVSGFVRAQAAYSLENENPNNMATGKEDDQDFNLIKGFLVADLEYSKPTDNGSFRIFTRWRANVDMTQDWSDGVGDYDAFPLEFDNDWTLARGDGDQAAGELWEAFADIRAGQAFFRLGRQNIVWGETEGLRTLDIINPLDLSQHLFIEAGGEQFDHIRIPVWAVRGQYEFESIPGYSIDAFVIPGDYVPTGLPDNGAPFNLVPFPVPPALFLAAPPPGPPFIPGVHYFPFSGLRAEDEVDERRGEWEGGVRLLGEIKGVQYTLNYISKIDPDGVSIFDGFDFLPGALPFACGPFLPSCPSGVVLHNYRERHDVYGASFNWFSSAVAGVFSGEVAFVPDQTYANAAGDALVERNTTKFALAFDRPTFIFPTQNAMGITFEWFQTEREGDEDDISILGAPGDKHETHLALLLRQPLHNGRYEVDFLGIVDTDDGYWLQPQVKYAPGDHWRLALYSNHFRGAETRPGRLGNLEWADEINLSVTFQY